MRKRFSFLFVTLLFIIALLGACNILRKTISVRVNGEVDSIFTTANTIYDIDTVVNLNGLKLALPDSCELHFNRGGKFKNGTVVGSNTKITGTLAGIFDNLKIEGTWNVKNISTSMFVETDQNTLHNLSVMCSEKLYNCVIIEDNCVIPIIHFSSLFNIPSNTDVELKADIQSLPTSYKGGYALQVNGCNIHIHGHGHKITGTIETDKSNNQQWQHGVFITRNSSNIVIEDVICTKFWGDGFYIMGSNIIIKGVESSYNGRQGLSLTHGHDIIIANSSFHHTGSIDICSCKGPGAGIDIEPNEGDVVNNIEVKNCRLYDNYKYMQGYINDFQAYNAPSATVKVKDCTLGGVYLGRMSDVTFENCDISESVFGIDRKVSGVTIRKSRIPIKSHMTIENIKIEK